MVVDDGQKKKEKKNDPRVVSAEGLCCKNIINLVGKYVWIDKLLCLLVRKKKANVIQLPQLEWVHTFFISINIKLEKYFKKNVGITEDVYQENFVREEKNI